jgi:PAS domain S-box-containing protein
MTDTQDETQEELIKELQETSFGDIFNLADVQRLQDLFADVHGVASVITDTEGKPITQPTNFTRLCENIIRKTEKGCANCYHSDAVIGRYNPAGAVVQTCPCGGLWDAGASITVGGRHIANWLIGQVRNKKVDEQRMMQYADEIGADKEDFKAALDEVPFMSEERFRKIADLLFVFANEISGKAYNNTQLNRQIAEKEKAIANLREREESLSITLHSIGDGVISTDINGLVISMNPVAETLCGWKLSEAAGKPLPEVFNIMNAETRQRVADPVKLVLVNGEIVGLANHTVLVSSDGTEYQIADSAAPIKNREGVITGVVLVFSDVSANYAAQKRIKESEERYRSLLHNLGAGIVVHAADTSIVMNNPRASELLGLSDDQMRGKVGIDPAWKFVNEDLTPLVPEKYPVNRIVSSRQPLKDQVLGIHQSGKNDLVWVTVNGFPAFDKTGDITEIVISFIDISLRKQEEESRREVDELFKLVFEYSNVGKSITSLGGKIMVNEAFCNLLGYKKEELHNKKWQEITHPDDLELTQNEVNKIRGGEVDQVRFIKRFLHKDGSVIWVDLSSSAMLTKAGELQLISTVVDITERKQAEELLKLSEERYRTLIESVSEGIILQECDGRILAWNASAERVFGFSAGEVEGHLSTEIMWQTTREDGSVFPAGEHPSIITLETGEPCRNIVMGVRTRDGRFYWININTNPLFRQNESKPYAVVISFFDITEQKQTQDELKIAKEKTEESERLLAKIAENYPNSFVSVIEKDLTVGFSGGQEFKRQNLNPNDFAGLTLEQVFGENEPVVKDYYLRTFNGEQTTFELVINDQHQLYKTVPLYDENGRISRILSVVENITQRKMAEEALRVSEEKFREMANLLPQIIFESDINGNLTYINNNAFEIFGYPEDYPIVGRSSLDFYTPESRLKAIENIRQKAIGNGKTESNEYVMMRKDGSTFPALVYSNRIIRENKPVGLRGIIININDLKQAEQALKESEARFKNMFEGHSSIMLLVEPESGMIIGANEASARFYGYSKPELLAMRIDEINILPPEQVKMERELALHEDRNYFIFPHRLASGEVRTVEVHSTPIVFQDQQILFSIIHDITGRRQAEIALQKSELEFHSLAEAMPQIVWITRPDGWNIFFNQQWVAYTGLSLEESYGTGWNKPFHPDDQQMAWDAWQKATTNMTSYSIECRIRRFDGEYKWWLIRGVPILDEIGNVQKWFGTCTDIDELKISAENLRVAKQHAEESDHLKSAFLANMSHEIRTPMNGILGFAEILKDPDLSGEQQKEYIHIIEKSGNRMLNIINDIVDISKIEAGLMKLEIKESNINEQIEYIYTFFKPEVEAKGMKLTFKTTLPARESTIKTDREKVYAILTNLVKNAIKYSKEGSIEFGYDLVDTQCIAYLQFYVKDTGIGIPSGRREAIFERFIQAEINDKMARQGAGLGLAITKSFVEMLGGKIRVESEEGVGSTFYFTLPYNTEPEEKAVFKTSVMHDALTNTTKTLKILIAEDDEASEMLIALTIKHFGKEILKARSGISAVEICRTNPDIDLVFMDIQMPEMGGYEAVRQIREFNKEVIIIAQTAYGLTGDREKAIEAGCNDYISKPIIKADLLPLIHKYFDK